jgi:hypothetical protein
MEESKGFNPRIQWSWLVEKTWSLARKSGSSGSCFAARRAAAASDASRAFSPCHHGEASLLCGKKKLVRRFPLLILHKLARITEGIYHFCGDG